MTQTSLVLQRLLDAPRPLVFEAFTRPHHLLRWFGPKGCAIDVHRFELRPGGVFLYSMQVGEGLWWGRWTFEAVQAPSRLVFQSSFADAAGNVARAPFAPHFPLLVRNELSLAEEGGKTALTLTGTPLEASAAEVAFFAGMRADMTQGWSGTFEQLDEALQGALAEEGRTLLITRRVAAPRALVFRALTEAEHLAAWFGPRGCAIVNHEVDVRAGGVWRFTMQVPGYGDFPNRIDYREVQPTRLVYRHGDGSAEESNAFEVTLTLTEEDGGTRVTLRSVFATRAICEEKRRFGAEELGGQTLAKLEALVAALV
jgi:uncharacterized protein YndB with AHSA1/START domain